MNCTFTLLLETLEVIFHPQISEGNKQGHRTDANVRDETEVNNAKTTFSFSKLGNGEGRREMRRRTGSPK